MGRGAMISHKEYKKLRNTKWDDLSEKDKEKRLKEFERRLDLANKVITRLVNKTYIPDDLVNEVPRDDVTLKDFIKTVQIIVNEKKGES